MCENNRCCKINAIVTVDAKGQLVLPKDLRDSAGIKPNDKLAVLAMEQDGAVCFIVMMKADALGSTVKGMLGPIFNEAFREDGGEQNER